MKEACSECCSAKLNLEGKEYCYFIDSKKNKKYEFHVYDGCQHISDVNLINKLENELIIRSLKNESLDDNI